MSDLQEKLRLLMRLAIGAIFWCSMSVIAATRSDITIILTDDLQSYFYKESVDCKDSICFYTNSLPDRPLWVIDDNDKPLQITSNGYKLENTSLSLMYKAKAERTVQPPSSTVLSFSLSYVSEHANQLTSPIQQRSVWITPDTNYTLQYRTSADDNWEKTGNVLKLETLSSANSQTTIILTKRTDSIAPHTATATVNTIQDSSQKELSNQCTKALDLISKAICSDAEPVVLDGLTFKRNSASLSPVARVLLDQLIQPLKKDHKMRFEINSYTDSKGPKRWNLALSQERADTIRQYLIFKGINPNQLLAVGYGESNPVATNNDKQGRSENRRIELRRHRQE